MTEYRYRVECFRSSAFDRFWEEVDPGIGIRRLKVLRKTPCGAWVDDYGTERFVLDGDGKRYAHETEEWAFHSFKIRKRHHLAHLKEQYDLISRVVQMVSHEGVQPSRHWERGNLTLGRL